jgi:hypothetical protein
MMETLTTPNGVATGYTYRPSYVWVDYPTEPPEPIKQPETDEEDGAPKEPIYPYPYDAAYQGFRFELLENPIYGQLRLERKALMKPEEEYFQVIAKRVRRWNALAAGDDGEVVPIPAPGETDDPQAWEAFLAIEYELLRWVLHVVRTGHHPKSGHA